MTEGLGVKAISEMYKEVHTVSHTRTRLKGDSIVNSAIDATIQRESEYTRKKSTCIEAETVFRTALESNTVMGAMPTFTGAQAARSKHKFHTDVNNSVKSALNVERRQKWEEHVRSLTVQGHNLALAAAEKQDLVWKSFMFDLKQGTLKFLLNAGIDTLPTAANLKRWKKSASDLCKLCKCRQTTDHVLSICKVALESGRYTWRHNCVINYIVNSIDEKYTVYSDLPGHTAPGGGSIPPEICVTTEKPDIVIIDKHNQEIHLYELTCPAERNIDQRHTDKSNKYAHFTTDITHFSCKVSCFEVSTKGFLNSRNHTTLNALHKFVKPNITKSQFKSNISAPSLTASYHIFLCKDEPTFLEPPYLLPPLVTKKATTSS